MRKPETECTDINAIEDVLKTADVGSMGIVTPDDYPRVVPVNYVSGGTTIYLHGALHGEKFDTLKALPKVTFNVYIAHSIIPSYWLANESAAGATHFFKSVQVNGNASFVERDDEKAHILQILMEKYQPEGNFRKVSMQEPMYQKVIKKTAIIRIYPERVSARFKFGQNYPEATRRGLIEKLEERAEGMDLKTAEEIRKTLENSDQ